MKLRIEQLVSLKEANQNFSKVARKVDEEGYVLLLRNNKPAYLLFAYDEKEVGPEGDDVIDICHRLLAKKHITKIRGNGR